MSVFTQPEIDYLTGDDRLARLATVGPDAMPHIAPVTFVYNADEDSIDIGGIDFGNTKKWRDAKQNPKVCFLLDGSTGRTAKALEVRGIAELHETGGESINPRIPGFKPQFLRIRPRRIVSWGLRAGGTAQDMALDARDV